MRSTNLHRQGAHLIKVLNIYHHAKGLPAVRKVRAVAGVLSSINYFYNYFYDTHKLKETAVLR